MKKIRGCFLTLLIFFSSYQDFYASSIFGSRSPAGATARPSTSRPPTTRPSKAPKTTPTAPPLQATAPPSESPSATEGEGASPDSSVDTVSDAPAPKKGKKGKAAQEDPAAQNSDGEKPASDDSAPPSEPVVATDTDPAKMQAMHPFQKTKLDAMRCLCEEAMFYSKRGEVNIKTAPPGVTLEQEKKYARDNYSNAMGLITTMLGDTQELTSAIEHMKKQKEDADLAKPDFCSIPKTDPATPAGEWNYKIHGEWKDKDEKSMSRSLGWKSKMALYARCISLSISGRNCAKHPKEKCAAKGVVASAMSSMKEAVMGKKDPEKKQKKQNKQKKKKKSPLGGIGGVSGMTPPGMAVNMETGGAVAGG